MKTPLSHYFFIAGLTALIFFGILLVLPISFSFDASDESAEPTSEDYLDEEEAVFVLEPVDGDTQEVALPIEKTLFKYVEVTDGCGPYFQDQCLNVRSGPGTEYDVVRRLRNGIVLKVDGAVERQDRTWYKVTFDEWLRYPERVQGDWYIAAEYVRVLLDEGDRHLEEEGVASTTKRIVVDRSEQKLYAYEGDELFTEQTISTGLELTPTPRGTFTVFKKTPSRYMQGPLPGISSDYYDLPGVPWNLYFTKQGAVIHGAYWHDNFGKPWSHGCVNVPLSSAEKLYKWAELGTQVIVRQ